MRVFHFATVGLLVIASGAFGGSETSPTVDLSGNWSGYWRDSCSGHTGPLKATFCQCDPEHYRVTFSGRFFKVFPFRYQVVLTVSGRDGDKIFLTGEQNLPLFGSFTYTAQATPADFTAQFCSRRYQGEFVLRRCCP